VIGEHSVSRSPTRWHAAQRALPTKSSNPRRSTSESAAASPPKRHRSKRESPAISVRSYAASAAPMRSLDAGFPPKAASNRPA
jgi:hypothetical protein